MGGNGTESDQQAAALAVVEGVLGSTLVGVYLYGSAVTGRWRPASDLDLLAVVRRPTTRDERTALARRLTPISRRTERPADWRPIELTVVAQADVKLLRDPPRTDFQYGEWLREDFDTGRVDPQEPHNPDLVVLLAQVRRLSRPLYGPPAEEVIDDVPIRDLNLAMVASVDALRAEIGSDTANVLLTLARIWHTLVTGKFVPKDEAANWSAARVDGVASRPLLRARAVYLGETDDEWNGMADDARLAADALTRAILESADA